MTGRIFIKDVGRFKTGFRADYSKATWNDIAKSAGQPLDVITKLVDEVVMDGVAQNAAPPSPAGTKRKRMRRK